jgi:hypothetical protein
MSSKKDCIMVMVLAAIQADGKELGNLSQLEIQGYVDSAVADLKFCYDVLGECAEAL